MDRIIAAILCPTAHRLHRPADNCRHRACVRIMEPLQLLIVASAYFFAAFVKGITGLGFSTTALPFLVLALGLKTTLPLLIIPSVVSNLIVMHGAGHFRSSLRQFWLLYASALPGLVVGLSLLATLDPGHSTAVLGAVLIVYCTFALARPDFRLATRLVRPLSAPIGLTNGIVNGLTGSQVMPVLPFLMSLHLEPDRFVQAANIFFTVSSLGMAVGLATMGLMTPGAVAVSLAGLVPVFFGIKIGTTVRRSLSPPRFRIAVLLVLALLGATLITRVPSS